LSVEPLLEDIGTIKLDGISWVIVGGESGPKARPIKSEWVESIRDQCISAAVPFFFKQWGGKNKKKAGRKLNGFTYSEFPDLNRCAVTTKSIRDERIDEVARGSQLATL
jgi:protein gp37